MTENAAEAIERLELQGATGCLTVFGPAGANALLYLVDGQVSHAESPAGEGNVALGEALGWWEATTTFDAQAKVPAKKTVAVAPLLPEIPEEWPDEELPEDQPRFGFDNDVRSVRALVVLAGLLVVVVVAALILSRKY